MGIKEILLLSIEALAANKFRSALTMLGMVIGVFAVIALVSLGQGAKNYVLHEFQSLGSNFIIIQPGKTDQKSQMGPPIGSAQRKMTLADVNALERRSYNLDAVSGFVIGAGQLRNEDSIVNTNILGVGEQFPRILALNFATGGFFTREETETSRRVIVLGKIISEKLFGNDGAVGRAVKINQTSYRVISVLAPMGNKLGLDLDQIAFIPVTAALRLFNEDKLFGIRARASSRVSLDDAVNEITGILKERRNGEEDFTILTQQAMMDTLSSILGMLSYVLGGIASISMLVGGVGIMNIMLVAIAERIPEIGIRRAVGARRRDILWQFLAEALMLTTLSGVLGILLAVALTFSVYAAYPAFDLRPPFWAIGGGLVLSLTVGIFFGTWPAIRASRIETLDALRHE